MYYSKIDIEDYLFDRTAPISYDTNMYKLEFVPFAKSKTPTIISTFGCHPESASFDWNQDESDPLKFDRKFTADCIWYIEKVMNAAGYNFIFIQGNVSTVSSARSLSGDELDGSAHYHAMRYGYEIGYILLGMSMNNTERIALNEKTGDKLGIAKYKGQEGYTVWYEGLPTVKKEEVKPVLNIKSVQFCVQIENNLIALLGKTSVADNLVLKDNNGNYYMQDEEGNLVVIESEEDYNLAISYHNEVIYTVNDHPELDDEWNTVSSELQSAAETSILANIAKPFGVGHLRSTVIGHALYNIYKYLQITDAFWKKICYNKKDYIYRNQIFHK